MNKIEDKNLYWYSHKFKQFALKPQQKDLQDSKFKYLTEIGFNENVEIEKTLSRRLEPLDIKRSIANTLQVTFEVTERCNLACDYCAYGELYKGKYEERGYADLNLQHALKLLDYLFNLWNSFYYVSFKRKIFISFYGGEPLLNISFIKQIVEYVNNKTVSKNFCFEFTMTTNALLLKKHFEFLRKYNFQILISLDGNKNNNQYRKYNNKQEAFEDIIDNIDYLYNNFSSFFKTNIQFNTVLHNKNSVQESINYIYSKYKKKPRLSELNKFGINDEKIDDFWEKYTNKDNSLRQSDNYYLNREKLFIDAPEIRNLADFIHSYTSNIYQTYLDFFEGFEAKQYIPTGTCIPFSRNIFLTVGGKLLPCETISHNHALGHIDNEGVHIDFLGIANKLNGYYDGLSHSCGKCYNYIKCYKCVFNLDLEKSKITCTGFMSKSNSNKLLIRYIKALQNEPEMYNKILEELYYV